MPCGINYEFNMQFRNMFVVKSARAVLGFWNLEF